MVLLNKGSRSASSLSKGNKRVTGTSTVILVRSLLAVSKIYCCKVSHFTRSSDWSDWPQPLPSQLFSFPTNIPTYFSYLYRRLMDIKVTYRLTKHWSGWRHWWSRWWKSTPKRWEWIRVSSISSPPSRAGDSVTSATAASASRLLCCCCQTGVSSMWLFMSCAIS